MFWKCGIKGLMLRMINSNILAERANKSNSSANTNENYWFVSNDSFADRMTQLDMLYGSIACSGENYTPQVRFNCWNAYLIAKDCLAHVYSHIESGKTVPLTYVSRVMGQRMTMRAFKDTTSFMLENVDEALMPAITGTALHFIKA